MVASLSRSSVPMRVLLRASTFQTAVGITRVHGDLIRNEGLAVALDGVDVVVHCATSLSTNDSEATANLLRAAKSARVKHLVYVSIVGIDTLTYFSYYVRKLRCEQLIKESGIPYSILRATQFYDLVLHILQRLGKGPLLILPRGAFLQPIEAQVVAERLATAAQSEPAGRMRDVAGPEVCSLRGLARAWLKQIGKRKPALEIPLPFGIFRVLSSGKLYTAEAEKVGALGGMVADTKIISALQMTTRIVCEREC